MTKQILISLALVFSFLFLFNACGDKTEKANGPEPATQNEPVAQMPKDSTTMADSTATKEERGEKKREEDDDDDDEKKQ